MTGQPSGSPQRVLIHGVSGRMGRETLAAVHGAPDMDAVGGVRLNSKTNTFSLPDGTGPIPLYVDAATAIAACSPQVMVDFSVADVSATAMKAAVSQGVHVVSGTTGISDANLQEIDRLAKEHNVGVLLAPNFAIGAVLLVHLASTLGRFFDYAEIIEAHHEAKLDAPSGTSIAIAKALASGRNEPFNRPMPEKELLPNSRGAEQDGVSIHAIRMQGRVAHQELILGTLGQTLSLRHDTTGRDCYMPGVLTAVRQVVQCKGLVVGLEKLLEL
jgi:4-hydroxy-tetrahydrodipicolinate reductase